MCLSQMISEMYVFKCDFDDLLRCYFTNTWFQSCWNYYLLNSNLIRLNSRDFWILEPSEWNLNLNSWESEPQIVELEKSFPMIPNPNQFLGNWRSEIKFLSFASVFGKVIDISCALFILKKVSSNSLCRGRQRCQQ